jgi:hypothetical protein
VLHGGIKRRYPNAQSVLWWFCTRDLILYAIWFCTRFETKQNQIKIITKTNQTTKKKYFFSYIISSYCKK